MRLIRYIVLIAILLIALGFALLNANQVTVNYYIGTRHMPLSLLLVFTFGLGCIVGLLTSLGWYFRASYQVYRLRKKLEVTEKELSNLRAMPLKDLS